MFASLNTLFHPTELVRWQVFIEFQYFRSGSSKPLYRGKFLSSSRLMLFV
jgi:hypothetical protein